jgi:Flp pilus assembly pilin Flp
MIDVAKTAWLLWKQRWAALREDEGASTIEYALLVLLGITVAGLVAGAVTIAVRNADKTIQTTKAP